MAMVGAFGKYSVSMYAKSSFQGHSDVTDKTILKNIYLKYGG